MAHYSCIFKKIVFLGVALSLFLQSMWASPTTDAERCDPFLYGAQGLLNHVLEMRDAPNFGSVLQGYAVQHLNAFQDLGIQEDQQNRFSNLQRVVTGSSQLSLDDLNFVCLAGAYCVNPALDPAFQQAANGIASYISTVLGAALDHLPDKLHQIPGVITAIIQGFVQTRSAAEQAALAPLVPMVEKAVYGLGSHLGWTLVPMVEESPLYGLMTYLEGLEEGVQFIGYATGPFSAHEGLVGGPKNPYSVAVHDILHVLSMGLTRAQTDTYQLIASTLLPWVKEADATRQARAIKSFLILHELLDFSDIDEDTGKLQPPLPAASEGISIILIALSVHVRDYIVDGFLNQLLAKMPASDEELRQMFVTQKKAEVLKMLEETNKRPENALDPFHIESEPSSWVPADDPAGRSIQFTSKNASGSSTVSDVFSSSAMTMDGQKMWRKFYWPFVSILKEAGEDISHVGSTCEDFNAQSAAGLLLCMLDDMKADVMKYLSQVQ